MAPKSKGEQRYLAFAAGHDTGFIKALPGAVREGFEYFGCDEYVKAGGRKHGVKTMLFGNGFGHFKGMVGVLAKYMGSIFGGREACFTALEPYLGEIKEKGRIENSGSLVESYPNRDVWDDIVAYGRKTWGVTLGFTELPEKLIFQDKAVLFPYALVLIQEMDKKKIDQAPDLAAGDEVQRVYSSLGLAVNDIARFLREKYGVKCQSNHPLGGLVDTSPLAGKAGLGWQGKNGLLITPDFGQRVRIAPIFIENRIFETTDNTEHRWIEDFCQTCGKCQRACPAGAILDERKESIPGVPGIGWTRTCIDRDKCFPQFAKTLGCSICVKVCPFSMGNGAYSKIKGAHQKKKCGKNQSARSDTIKQKR